MSWYGRITKDLGEIPGFIRYCEKELLEAREDIDTSGNLEKNLAQLPAITEVRFSQLQEVEAVLNLLNIEMRKIRKGEYIKYERYQKALSSREIEKYVDGEDDVTEMDMVINEVALIRNKFLSIMKALESKNFMLGHITRLRSAGMEDVEIQKTY